MQLAQYATYDGLGLAELLRSRQTTPKEIGQCVIAALAQLNPKLNAVVEIYADAIDSLDAAPGAAPFHGLPILSKDFPLQARRPAEYGSVFARGYRTAHDYSFWRKLRDGGLVNIGRTAASEFGIAAATESSLYGPTRNPWNLERGVAGSSGGSAAAVAAGIVPFATGSDAGGSIRTPASFCGLVGLKPSRARISGAPETHTPLLGLETSFMLTRSVRDTAALLDLAAGPVQGDGYEIAPPETCYLHAIQTPPGKLRIAICTTSWSAYPLCPEVAATVVAVGHKLRALGHEVVEATPKFHYESYLAAQKVLWGALIAHSLEDLAGQLGRPIDPHQLQSSTYAVYLYGKSVTAVTLLAALSVYDQVTRLVGEFLAEYDVLVTPTCPTLPEPIGTHDPARPGHTIDTVFDDLAPKETFTALFNATGSPALSLPLGQSQSGLPIGVQFVSSFGREARLLRLAAVLESEYAWHRRAPLIHVSSL